jgi:hypothetical protein
MWFPLVLAGILGNDMGVSCISAGTALESLFSPVSMTGWEGFHMGLLLVEDDMPVCARALVYIKGVKLPVTKDEPGKRGEGASLPVIGNGGVGER